MRKKATGNGRSPLVALPSTESDTVNRVAKHRDANAKLLQYNPSLILGVESL